jgi:hypothetical protein
MGASLTNGSAAWGVCLKKLAGGRGVSITNGSAARARAGHQLDKRVGGRGVSLRNGSVASGKGASSTNGSAAGAPVTQIGRLQTRQLKRVGGEGVS